MDTLKKTVRQSNIELLRILSMLMIVFHHGFFHGGTITKPDFSVSYLWAYFIGNGGSIGVVIFFLISGYFLIDEKKTFFNYKRILKFWVQCFFYSILFTVILDLNFFKDFSLEAFAKGFLPILTIKWWFASSYFVVYLIHPFINIMLNNLDKSAYKKLIMFLIIAWFIIPTITNLAFQSNEFVMAASMYCIGGYIKKFGFNPRCQTKHYVLLFSLLFLLTYLVSLFMIYFGRKHPIGLSVCYFFQHQKITSLALGILLFMIFVSVKPFYNRLINLIASTTFGVYLIHEYPTFKYIIWGLFNGGKYYNSILFIPVSVSMFLLVFTGCSVIELIRKYTVGRLVDFVIDKKADTIFKPFQIVYQRVTDLIFGKE